MAVNVRKGNSKVSEDNQTPGCLDIVMVLILAVALGLLTVKCDSRIMSLERRVGQLESEEGTSR